MSHVTQVWAQNVRAHIVELGEAASRREAALYVTQPLAARRITRARRAKASSVPPLLKGLNTETTQLL